MTGLTKKERQAIDRAAVKCWCGNVAGLGQTLCGKHRDEEPDPFANIPDPAAFVAAAMGMEAALHAMTFGNDAAAMRKIAMEAVTTFRTAMGGDGQ